MIQETSEEAYRDEIKPTLDLRQEIVLKLFRKMHPTDITNSEIARLLSWQINTVTPRVFELRQQGEINLSRKRKCKVTGRNVMAWKLPPLFQEKLI